MPAYYDLNRRFVERPKYDPDELIASEISGNRLNWDKVLESRFAVIVAPANYGKSTEMAQRASHIRAAGGHAFFVALRKVSSGRNLEKALAPEELGAFNTWLASPITPITVFVDSIDEASANKNNDIDYLINEVAQAVQWPNPQVRWVISTRPAMLTADVISKLNAVLPIRLMGSAAANSVSVDPASGDITITQHSTRNSANGPEILRLHSMLPLNTKQAELYLNKKYAAGNTTTLLKIARERGLNGFTTSPGGLDVLANIDLITHPPVSLSDVFERVIGAVQELQRQDHRLSDAGNPPPKEIADAARKLAAASQVCQLPNIEMPETQLGVTEGILSARLIAGGLLTDNALQQLLNTQLFIDVGHHQVKLYPDELPPFLAAQRLAGRVGSPEQAHKLVAAFSWNAPTGEHGISRQYLPLMGWLATLSSLCREEILARDPQAVAFFGDLRNRNMPIAVAQTALRESIRRLVTQGDRLGRGYFTLTSENFWQAGPDALKPLIKNLYKQYSDHHLARDALLDIVTSTKSDALRTNVLKEHGNNYSRLLFKSIDVRYLLELGHQNDLRGLAHALKINTSASEGLVATLIPKLGWNYFTPKEISTLVHNQFKRGRGGFHMGYALEAGFLDDASDKQLFSLSRSLVIKASLLRSRDGHTRKTVGRTDDRYIEIVILVLASLVSRPSCANPHRVALLCLVMQRIIIDAQFGGTDISKLHTALLKNTPVRLCLLKQIVSKSGTDSNVLSYYTYGYGAFCPVSQSDVTALGLVPLTVLFEQQAALQAEHRAKPQLITGIKDDHLKVDSGVKRELSGMLEQLRDGTATNGIAWIARWLLQTNPSSRYGEIQFDILERECGPEIAQAVREGFSTIWRNRQPIFNEGEPRATNQITIAGLQGLHLELGDGKQLPELNGAQVKNALNYGQFEINGYPKWFWPLVNVNEVVAGKVLFDIANSANAGAVSLEHAENLFTNLQNAPKSIQDLLAPLAWKYALTHSELGDYVVEKLLNLTVTLPKVISQSGFERIAWKKISTSFAGPPTGDDITVSSAKKERSQSIVWASIWLKNYPKTFQKAIAHWLKKAPLAAQEFIFEIAAYFGNERRGSFALLAQASDDGLKLLGALYEWTLNVVKPDKDIDHTDGEVYSPNSRDHAQDFRDALIPAISSARSQLAYEILDQLQLSATPQRVMYLKKVQFDMREAQFTSKPIHQKNYDNFENNFTAEITDTKSFSMAIHSDLQAVKYDIEKGEYSLRRFFSELSFQRLITDKEGLALEADFQWFLASELNHLAKGRYSIALEPHTAESKRHDILCSNGTHRASIELKMSRHWKCHHYLEALEKQLVGQYMRHRNATTGFLVVVLQDALQKWIDPDTSKSVDFNGLLAILKNKALSLEAKNRNLYLRVIGIDATTPIDFRKKKLLTKQIKSPKQTKPLKTAAKTKK